MKLEDGWLVENCSLITQSNKYTLMFVTTFHNIYKENYIKPLFKIIEFFCTSFFLFFIKLEYEKKHDENILEEIGEY